MTPASQQVVQAKVGISFELRDLPVDDADPIVDVTVAATRPAISQETRDTVLERQSLDSIPSGHALRHIIPYDTLVKRLEGGLIGKNSKEASKWLWQAVPVGAPDPPTRTLNTQSMKPSTNRSDVEDQALNWLKRWQNHPANLFVGTSAENQSRSNVYDDPTRADNRGYQQKFPQKYAIHQLAEAADEDRPVLGNQHWFSQGAEQEFVGKIKAEKATLEWKIVERKLIEWLVGENPGAAKRILSFQKSGDLSDNVPWQSCVETLTLVTRGRTDRLAAFIPSAWERYGGGVRDALYPQIQPVQQNPQNNQDQNLNLKRLPYSILPPPDHAPRSGEGNAEPQVAIGFGRLPLGGPFLVQRKEGVDVSYELESQPIDQHAPITSVTVSGARPAIRPQTKLTVLARYDPQQQQEMVSSGTTLNRGYVWRHIIPYATLATRLEAGLEGKTQDEANHWLSDKRPLGAPQEVMPADTLSPLNQLQRRANSWLDGWQNNPANLFIGTAEENSSLKDKYDDPRAADNGAYAQQHKDPKLFLGEEVMEGLKRQTKADRRASLSQEEVETEMMGLLRRMNTGVSNAILREVRRGDGNFKLRGATGWRSLIDLYIKRSKGRPKPGEDEFAGLWDLWWPRFESSILYAMQSGIMPDLIPLGDLDSNKRKPSGGQKGKPGPTKKRRLQ